MSTTNSHPWLVNKNATPTSDINFYRYAARSMGINTRGVDARDIRAAVNNQLGVTSNDPQAAIQAFQARTQSIAQAQMRPPAPYMESNNTATPFQPMIPVIRAGQGGGGGLPESERDHPFKVTPSGANVVVSASSFLFGSLDHTDIIAISGLGAPFSPGASIWLTITFGAWPTVSSATIDTGSFPAGGEIEDSGGAGAVQTIARLVIATISGSVITQLINSNHRMEERMDASLPIFYPVPI